MFRQGDILIVPYTDVVTGKGMPHQNGKLILAEGEATGHAHVIYSNKANFYRPDDIPSGILGILVAEEPVDLVHEEHGPISIPKGKYLVKKQREYRLAGTNKYIANRLD